MANYDGSVIINTGLDVKNLKKDANAAIAQLRKLSDASAKIASDIKSGLNRAIPTQKMAARIDEIKRKISSLEGQLREFAATEIQTAEFSKLAAEIEKAHKKLESLMAREDKLSALGVSEDSAQWRSLQYDLEMAARKYAELEAQRDKMLADGTATISGAETEEYKKLSDALEEAKIKLAELQRQHDQNAAASGKSSSAMAAWSKNAQKSMDGIAKSTHRFGTRLREIVRGALIFNFISAGLRSVTTRFADALKSNDAYTDAVARLKGAFYTAFQPLYEAVIPALVTFIRLLTVAVQAVGRFFAAITGKDYSQMEKNAEALYNQKKAIDGVSASAKDAQKDLAGFDEINRMSSQDSGGGAGGAAGGVEIPPLFSGAVDDAEKLLDIVLDIGAAILGWKISKAFSSILTSLTGTTLTAPQGFLLTLAGVGIALAVKDIIVNWDDIEEMLLHEKNAAIALFNGETETFWAEADKAALLSLQMEGFFPSLTKKIVDAINGDGTWDNAIAYLEAGGSLEDVWGYVATWFNEHVIQPVSQFFTDLWEDIKQLPSDAWDKIKEVWETVSTWFDEHVIQPVSEFFTDLWEDIKQLPSDAWDKIKEVWGTVSTWFDEKVIQPVSEFFTDLWEDIKQLPSDAWNSIKEVWGKVSTWFKEKIIDPIAEFFSGLWNGVSNSFKSVVNGVIGFVNGMISAVIKGINWVIRALNKVSFDIPDWVPLVGGKKFGFDIGELSTPQIPYLAKGAVIPPNAPFVAMLGDQRRGTNIEAPLDTIKQAVAEVLRGSSGGNPDIHVTIVLDSVDGKKLFDAVVKQNNAVVRATGASPLKV